jgi:tetratricopeptide (TPR) repeat protein
MNSETIIVGLSCLFLVIAFFLFKPQFFILLNRLARINVRGAKNLQYTDQDVNLEIDQDIKRDLPTQSWLTLPPEKFGVLIIVFVILSSVIYILFSSFSIILVQIGNIEFSAGYEKFGIATYNLALEFNRGLKTEMNQCNADNAQKQYEQAIEHCSNAIEINENYANAYFSRGYAYKNEGQYELAIADFTKSIEINPKEEQAYLNRGLSYIPQRQSDLAIIDCNKAIEFDQKYWYPYLCLGAAYDAQDKYDLAITNFDKAIELDPNIATTYWARGATYGLQEKKELAIADYTKSIEVDPNFIPAYSSRGAIYAEQKDYALAISDFSKIIEIDPNNVDAYTWRGNIFADTKKFTQAIADYQKALTISKDSKANSYIYCVQGVTYTKMGDFKLAITSLEQGVKLNDASENDWCKSALENARQGTPTP